jgi:hypothetical protein
MASFMPEAVAVGMMIMNSRSDAPDMTSTSGRTT